MPVPERAYRMGDVYIDYPQEEVMFHFVHETGRVFRKFYGEAEEDEVPPTSDLLAEAERIGTQTTAERYRAGAPRGG